MNLPRRVAVVFLLIFHGSLVYSQGTIDAVPSVTNQDVGETSTVTGNGLGVLSNHEIDFIDSILCSVGGDVSLIEVSQDASEATFSDSSVPSGAYFFRVFNRATTTSTGPLGFITLQGIATPIKVQPNPFVQMGTNAVAITLEATPGQVGIYVYLYQSTSLNSHWHSCISRPEQTETATLGIHTVQWDAVGANTSGSCGDSSKTRYPLLA